METSQKVLYLLVSLLAFGLNTVIYYFALQAGPFMYAVLAAEVGALCLQLYLKGLLAPSPSPYSAIVALDRGRPRKRPTPRVPPQPRGVGTYTPERSPSPYEARPEGDEKHESPPLELRELAPN